MVDYEESSHLNQWLFTELELEECRAKVNHDARVWLTDGDKSTGSPPTSYFACHYSKNKKEHPEDYHDKNHYLSQGPWQNTKGNDFLKPEEESTLIAFYASKIPALIGPKASVSRLRRESKVTATAALLYRRFFLSNSVHLFDPKAVMVAAAFLAAKVEDAMVDVRYLQEGTERMQAPVTQQEIISAELQLLQGCHYDLLCFHPFKSVLALTEDLRTFLKSEKGLDLVSRPISGQDLKPIYDKSRVILEKAINSDLTLLYSPGPIGMASLIVAQDEVLEKADRSAPKIDFYGYIQQRFPEKNSGHVLKVLSELCQKIKALPPTMEIVSEEAMAALKHCHKKLKKVRGWGATTSEKKKKKKSKSRATTPVPTAALSTEDPPSAKDVEVAMPPPKKVKIEEPS